MGIGNLQHVLGEYNGGEPVPYAQLYFDTAPDRHPATYRLLAGFGDQSSLYYWRVLGAVPIMRLYRDDRAALARLDASDLARLNRRGPAPPRPHDDVCRPGCDLVGLRQPRARPAARQRHRPGLAYGRNSMRSLAASESRRPCTAVSGRRPSTSSSNSVAGEGAERGTRAHRTLIVARAVTDVRYQHAPAARTPSDTGYAFPIDRRYDSRTQAAAFQAMLDRLQALNLIAWERTLSTIDVTVASDASR